MLDISFSYENTDYLVDSSAYDVNRIKLPDRKVLYVPSWLESNPPVPESFEPADPVFLQGLEIPVARVK